MTTIIKADYRGVRVQGELVGTLNLTPHNHEPHEIHTTDGTVIRVQYKNQHWELLTTLQGELFDHDGGFPSPKPEDNFSVVGLNDGVEAVSINPIGESHE